MTMLRRSKRLSGARLLQTGLALAMLIGSAVGLQAQPAFAAYGNPAVIGPLPTSGTIRVYVQQNVGSPPDVRVVDGSHNVWQGMHVGRGNYGLADFFSANAGDTVQVYVYNADHGDSNDPGWESPQGQWWCGHNGAGDGIKDFSGMEAAVEAAGAPIVSRECWEDYDPNPPDGGYEDVTVIVTYNPATVDTTAPTTTPALAGTLGLNGAHQWYVSPVQVSLSATDPDDAVSATYLDGAAYTGPKAYSAQGQNTFTYYSVDSHNNTEATKTGNIWVDTVVPTASSSLAGTVGLAGWYISPVQVTVGGADSTSGINALELDGAPYTTPKTFSALGTTNYTYRAQDGAGNWSATQNGSFKIDADLPTVSSSLAGTLGGGGWYVSPVQVTLTGSDPTSGLGSLELNGASYSGLTSFSGQGVTNYTYRARDVAGNWSALQNGSFKIDTVPPTVSPVFTGTAGHAGWYISPVQIGLTGSDASSGVAGFELNGSPYAGPITTSSDGTTNFTYRGQDVAGNWSALQNGSVKLDTIPPATASSLSGTLGLADWYSTGVQVTLNSSDATSDVGSLSLDGTPYTTPRTYADGVHSITYFATDVAGNVETAHTQSFNVDTVPPVPSVTITGTAGSGGWYRSAVQIGVSATDATSGVGALELNSAPYTGPLTVSAEGTINYTYRAQDVAGNWSALQTGSVKVDTVPPSTTVSLMGTMGSGGWYNTPVQVTLNSSDATAGVGSITLDGTPYTTPRTYGDGTHTITYFAADNAGNVETAHNLTFQVDTTPPVPSSSLSGTPGAGGWYVSPVQITVSAVDATSGADALELNGSPYSGPVTASEQGTTNYTYRAQDVAGNWSALQNGSVKIDTVPPATTANPAGAFGLAGWYVSPVSLSLTTADATSGVASTTLNGTAYTTPRTYTDGSHLLSYSSADNAGNVETAHSLTLNIDAVPPTVTESHTGTVGLAGWFASPVQVTLTGSDATSGLAALELNGSAYTGPTTISTQGANTVSYRGRDVAGNWSTLQTASFNVDTVPPVTSDVITGTQGSSNIYVTPVQFSLSAVDAASGVARIYLNGAVYTGTQVLTDGVHSLTYYATDVAGNSEPPHSQTIQVDTSIPHTTLNVSGPQKSSSSGWYTGDVTVSLSVSKPGCTSYLNGQVYTGRITLSGDGYHNLSYYSVDQAGNTEATHTATIKIDGSAPGQTGSATLGPDGLIHLNLTLIDSWSGVDSGGIYVMSPTWQQLKLFSFSGYQGLLTWNGLLDNGQLPPAGYFFMFYGRDHAGNDGWHQLGGLTLPGTPAPTPSPTVTRSFVYWTRSPTLTPTRTPGPTAIGAATDTPTDPATPTPPSGAPAADTATVFVPSPVPATYEPLPTATRPAPMVAVAPVLPSEPLLNMGLVLAAVLCLTSAIFAAYLTSRIDPRPQAIRDTANLLEKQQRFVEES